MKKYIQLKNVILIFLKKKTLCVLEKYPREKCPEEDYSRWNFCTDFCWFCFDQLRRFSFNFRFNFLCKKMDILKLGHFINKAFSMWLFFNTPSLNFHNWDIFTSKDIFQPDILKIYFLSSAIYFKGHFSIGHFPARPQGILNKYLLWFSEFLGNF